MASTHKAYLTKSRFQAGLQCHKRLHMEVYSPKLKDPVGPSQQALFQVGSSIGVLARQLFPGGRHIGQPAYAHNQAEQQTVRLLSDRSIPALFESAFSHSGIRVRPDILRRVDHDTFDLIEVKGSTSVKEEHIPDVAIQLYVLEQCGLSMRDAYILHIDNRYIYQGGEYELDKLFQMEDVTSDVRSYVNREVPANLSALVQVLDMSSTPVVEIGRHCGKPYQCPFYHYCRRDQPEHRIEQLPRLSQKLEDQLKAIGITDIRAIPSAFNGLNALQRRVREVVMGGKPFLSSNLRTEVTQLEAPLHFLDFETFNPALPLYPGTRPYQVIPFQWSMHTLLPGGELLHQGYLHDGTDDPRDSFIESVLKATESPGKILVYSSYESTRLGELGEAFPVHLSALEAVRERLVDLLPVIRDNVYHPDFHGSFSIKSVLPALVPDLGYDDLEIGDGSVAAVAYAELMDAATSSGRKDSLRTALWDYCQRDTLALVRLHHALDGMVNSQSL